MIHVLGVLGISPGFTRTLIVLHRQQKLMNVALDPEHMMLSRAYLMGADGFGDSVPAKTQRNKSAKTHISAAVTVI